MEGNKVALGAYLKILRRGRGLSRRRLADMLYTTETQIERIEEGKLDTRCSMFVAFVREVGGSLDIAADLILNRDATAKFAEEKASELIEEEQRAAIASIIRSILLDEKANSDSSSLELREELIDQILLILTGKYRSVLEARRVITLLSPNYIRQLLEIQPTISPAVVEWLEDELNWQEV